MSSADYLHSSYFYNPSDIIQRPNAIQQPNRERSDLVQEFEVGEKHTKYLHFSHICILTFVDGRRKEMVMPDPEISTLIKAFSKDKTIKVNASDRWKNYNHSVLSPLKILEKIKNDCYRLQVTKQKVDRSNLNKENEVFSTTASNELLSCYPFPESIKKFKIRERDTKSLQLAYFCSLKLVDGTERRIAVPASDINTFTQALPRGLKMTIHVPKNCEWVESFLSPQQIFNKMINSCYA